MPNNTLATNLQRLVDAKSDIADAITTMGGTVNQGDGFEEFPADILTIPTPPPTPTIYGYHVNPSESDPAAAVTYVEDAVGMTPAKMGASSFSYGSWGDAWFLPKPCMLKSDGTVDYYLDPNDYSKKADGTASDIANQNYDGNVMMEFPKIYIKRVPGSADGERTVYIAQTNVDGNYKCFSNVNASNQEIDHFYMAAYDICVKSSKTRSLSGVTLNSTNAPSTTVSTEVSTATANGSTWYTGVWADWCLVYDLLYLMGKSLDLQGTYGQGITSGSQSAKESYVTGSLNDKGLFYGDISGTSTAVKTLGIENFWGLRYKRIAGLLTTTTSIMVKMTRGTYDGSTASDYNTTGSGYLNFGTPANTGGYVSKMTADNVMGYKATAFSGSSSTYYCDYGYYSKPSSNTYYAYVGGDSGAGADCGFSVILYSSASGSTWYIGGSLSCKP